VIVGVLQVLLGLAQVGGGHVGNESAAWNIALGAAFVSVARAGRCPAGLPAMLAAFGGMLLLLSVSDLVSGRVDPDRLATHLLLITGFLLVLQLSRRRR
jgi:predicted anti-sigma-YlaC factor YlaD